MTKSNKLALGSAQFGLNYGISNNNGTVDIIQTNLILEKAKKHGINTIDTAIVYGDSEKLLGEIGVTHFDLITKLPPLPSNQSDIRSWLAINLNLSLKKLNLPKIYGLLLHRSADLIGQNGKKYYDELLRCKEKGLIKKIGVSIYDPQELNIFENEGIELDIIQAPFNVFDRRLELSGWMEKLSLMKKEIHVRSIFLQGFLLLSPEQRPKYFSRWGDHLRQWDNWLDINEITPLEACINFLKPYTEIDKIVVGVTNENELSEIINIFENNNVLSRSFVTNDQQLINPSNWQNS